MKSESVTTIYFTGGLDIGRYPELHGYFEACPPNARLVLIDLSSVTYVDSVFLTELLMFSNRYERNGAALAVVADGNIARMLTVSGLDKRLNVSATRELALKFFASLPESKPSSRVIAEEFSAPQPDSEEGHGGLSTG